MPTEDVSLMEKKTILKRKFTEDTVDLTETGALRSSDELMGSPSSSITNLNKDGDDQQNQQQQQVNNNNTINLNNNNKANGNATGTSPTNYLLSDSCENKKKAKIESPVEENYNGTNETGSGLDDNCDDDDDDDESNINSSSLPVTKVNGVSSPSSKVIHIRNVPMESTESDLLNLGIPFGKITNILLLKGKNQAFIEFEQLSSATSMVSYWLQQQNSTSPTNQIPMIRGKPVFIQFSNHKEITSNQNSVSPSHPHYHSNNNNQGSGDSNVSSVLRVIIDQLVYPVSLEMLHALFSRFGRVLKIVLFTKNQTFQSLIQYDSVLSAQTAKLSLDKTSMFSGGNLLKIEFSKLNNLNVKYNCEKSRDFTNPSLPSGNSQSNSGNSTSSYDILDPLSTFSALPFGLSAASLASPFAPPLTARQLSGLTAGGAPGTSSHHGYGALSPMSAHHATSHLSLHSAANLFNSSCAASSVLLVSNLNEQMNPDVLFTLFGVYGDVIRVKILFKNQNNALIQMNDATQALIACQYLDKIKLFGRTIKITPSKHSIVQMPKEGTPDSGLTKDYSNSPLHRFKKPGSKNYSNIYPPSSTLHLSNIPLNYEEEDLRQLFEAQTNGIKVKGFKFFPKDKKMALISFETQEEAIISLIKLHNHPLSESSHLRVSFSKSSI